MREAAVCCLWLLTEIAVVRPAFSLGATADKALLGTGFTITQSRGTWATGPGHLPTLIAFHPAYLLRLEEPALSQVQASIDTDLAAVRVRLKPD